MRFEATLTDTRKVTVTVPGKVGEMSHVIEVSRIGQKLVVAKPQFPADTVIVDRPKAFTD